MSDGPRILPLRLASEADAEDQPSDEALVAACVRQDSAALGTLYDRHSGAIFRFLSRLAGVGRADLDELVSETFIHVYRSAGRFRGEAAVRTWITAIAANVGRHHVRSEARRRAFLTIFRGSEPVAAVETHKVAERRLLLLQRLAGLVAALPYNLRVVYVMCDLEELPGVEVARTLKLAEGTLWRRLHEARRCLRAWLEGEPAP